MALAAPLVAVMSVGAVASSLTNASAAVAMPDLVVTSIAKPTATAGGQVQFSATVKNQGTAATPAGVIIGVQFQVDAKSAFTWSDTDKTSLAPGASVTLTANGGQAGASWTATTGTHSVRAYVDDVNRIGESNEANNILTSPFTTSAAAPIPPAMPDLVVTGMTPPTATAGGPVQFAATVKNQGTAATPAGVIIGVQFQVDAKSAFTWSDTDKTSLAAGASVTLTANGGQSGATWTATAGTHTVRALVDDINRIAEANETNNAYTLTYTTSVAAPPPTTVPPTTVPPTVPPVSSKGALFGSNGQQYPLIDLGSWKNAVDKTAGLGMKWVRGDWAAQRVPPLAASWAASDAAVDYAASRGLRVMVELHNQGSTPPSGAQMATAGASIVTHYKTRSPGVIGAVEVWNEPNLAQFWSPVGDGSQYAAVVKAVYPAVKAADPNMPVLAGSMSPGPGLPESWGYPAAAFLTNVYNAGMHGYFDAVAYHPYPPQNDPSGSIASPLAALDQLHAIMAAHGDANKQIWSTETGASTAPLPVGMSEAAQATAYAGYFNAVLSGTRPWLGVMIFHSPQDNGGEMFGWYRSDGSPKPVVNTIKSFLG